MPSATASVSRRKFLDEVTGGLASKDGYAASVVREPAPAPSLAEHVANRLTYGPKPGDVAAIESQSVDAWIASQLNPDTTDTPELAAALAALPSATLSESVTTLYDRRYLGYWMARQPLDEVRHYTIAHMLHSKWQLREMMVEFWHDHFSVYGYDSPIMCLFPEWDRIMRQHAFGNFRTFLESIAKHPVMLHFLDNYLSTNAGPNENFARELFELHSLGAINYNTPDGYKDEDVYESSRCFTGWSYEREETAPGRGQFKFVSEDHDRFQKQVLGTAIPHDQAALVDGLTVLDLICNHVGTARHIVLKMCRRFVGENPPVSLVDSATTVFYSNRAAPNQIGLTLEHIFDSAEFRDAANRGNRFKRPYDWMMSTMRALSIPYVYIEGENAFEMTYIMSALGYLMFGWRSPEGPPDSFFAWATANNMLQRYNFIFRIDAGWWEDQGLVFPAATLLPANLQTARQICLWWVDRIIQRPVSTSTFEGLLVFAAEGRNYDLPLPQEQIDEKVSRIAALCTVTPEFMWR